MAHVLMLPSWYPSALRPHAGTFCREQAVALADYGHDVTVVALESVGPRELPSSLPKMRPRLARSGTLRELTFSTPRVPKSDATTTWITTRLWAGVARAATAGRPPDLVHAHGVHDAGIAGRLFSRSQGVPLFITEHYTGYARGILTEAQKRAARDVLGGADCAMAVSAQLAQTLAPYRRDMPVVPNMVDVSRFGLPAQRPQVPFRLVTVGHLQPKKRVDLCLRAFHRAFGSSDDVRLGVVGDGPQRPQLEALARELDIHQRVDFFGALDRDGVRGVLHSAHGLVSTSDYETFGIVLIEAMATGLPVIATRSGGPEGIVDEDNGYLVDTGDEQGVSERMTRLYEERARWSAAAPTIAETTAAKYGPRALAEALSARYERHLG